jgi:hypothetical protein
MNRGEPKPETPKVSRIKHHEQQHTTQGTAIL